MPNVGSRRTPGAAPHLPRPGGASALPESLHHAGAATLDDLKPGDLILLDDMTPTEPEPLFCAVLACPRCGTPGLITTAQYQGVLPVTCSSEGCSCQFKIDDQSILVYLPVN